MHTTPFPLAEDMVASALADTWISPIRPTPAQQPIDQSRGDPAAIGCKDAHCLERMFFFTSATMDACSSHIKVLTVDGCVS